MGAQDSISQKKESGKVTPPSVSRLFSIYSKYATPETEDQSDDENWEEDTNDTEIMKNINSLLDSGNFIKLVNISQYNRPIWLQRWGRLKATSLQQLLSKGG